MAQQEKGPTTQPDNLSCRRNRLYLSSDLRKFDMALLGTCIHIHTYKYYIFLLKKIKV